MDRRTFYTFISLMALAAVVAIFIFVFKQPNEDHAADNTAFNAAQQANDAAAAANQAAERAQDQANSSAMSAQPPAQTIVDHREIIREKEVQVPAQAKPAAKPAKPADAAPVDVESTTGAGADQ